MNSVAVNYMDNIVDTGQCISTCHRSSGTIAYHSSRINLFIYYGAYTGTPVVLAPIRG